MLRPAITGVVGEQVCLTKTCKAAVHKTVRLLAFVASRSGRSLNTCKAGYGGKYQVECIQESSRTNNYQKHVEASNKDFA